MNELLANSIFFGAFITIFAFYIGLQIQKKIKHPLANPLLIAIIIIIGFLLIFDIDYKTYDLGASKISYLLTPATVCLAIPLYDQITILKSNIKAILMGIISGVVATMVSVLGLSMIFHLDHEIYVTLLPKSITTAIGMGVSEEIGGIVTITIVVIIVTGIIGNMIAVSCCRLFKITDPIAKGIAIGSSSHAVGTAKALEIGEVEGAMSSLSIVISGILTVILATIFAGFY